MFWKSSFEPVHPISHLSCCDGSGYVDIWASMTQNKCTFNCPYIEERPNYANDLSNQLSHGDDSHLPTEHSYFESPHPKLISTIEYLQVKAPLSEAKTKF